MVEGGNNMNQSAYLDLQNSLVYELAGDVWLFFFVGIIILWVASIKYKVPYQIPLLLSLMFGGIMYSIEPANTEIIWIMALLGAGGMFYYGISRILNRG